MCIFYTLKHISIYFHSRNTIFYCYPAIWNDRDPVQERSSGVEYQTLNTSKWWDAAQGCEEFGGQLYVPGSEDIPQDLMDALDEDELYWVGAVKNSKWIWTCEQWRYNSNDQSHQIHWKYLVSFTNNMFISSCEHLVLWWMSPRREKVLSRFCHGMRDKHVIWHKKCSGAVG